MKNLILILLLGSFFNSCVRKPIATQVIKKNVQQVDERFEKIQQLALANIFNPTELESEAWSEFATQMNTKEVKALSGIAYEKAFNQAAQKLPFTHFYIRSSNSSSSSSKVEVERKPDFELEEISHETIMLHIRSFSQDAAGMVELIQQIRLGEYANLIIDLRGNTGGTLDAAIVLGMFLSNTPLDAGTYINRSWFDANDRLPTMQEIQGFPFLQDFTYEGFVAVQSEKAFRMFLPPHEGEIYEGRVFLLTDNNTASACEPVVDVLKRNNIATVVGEKTSGAMLSAEWFKVNNEYSIFIPVTYYLNNAGKPLDKVGVTPDIEVPGNKALEEVLRRLGTE